MIRSILVATDGMPGAKGALRMARRLADRDGVRVEVVAVYEPITLYGVETGTGGAPVPPRFAVASMEALRERVAEQLAEVGGPAPDWPVTIEVGLVAQIVARLAVRRGAGMIVMGLRHPGPVERWLARETLLRLAHLAHVPILAVRDDATDLPRRALVSIDFSSFSTRVANAVVEPLAIGGRVDLVHVTWSPLPADHWSGVSEWQTTYRAGVEQRLGEVASTVAAHGGVDVHTYVAAGDPADEILRLADEVGADLIAAGSHGLGFVGRVVMGSVSSRLVHGARCSLLIAPPLEVAPELRIELSERELLANLGMAAELALAPPPPRMEAVLMPDPARESGVPGGGAGRRDEAGGSGVYPASLEQAPADAVVRGQAEWGQGDLGARGAEEAGSSELFFYDAELKAAGLKPKTETKE